MKEYIKYSKAQKLSNFQLPINCPNCNKMWKPEMHCMTYKEGFSYIRMAQLHTKRCEFCGFTHQYYA